MCLRVFVCVKICVKIFHLRFSGKAHKSFRSRKSDLINSGNLVELSQHRVEGRDSNLENQLVSVYEFFLFWFCHILRQTVILSAVSLFYSMVGKYE